jgi:hypothetical protein
MSPPEMTTPLRTTWPLMTTEPPEAKIIQSPATGMTRLLLVMVIPHLEDRPHLVGLGLARPHLVGLLVDLKPLFGEPDEDTAGPDDLGERLLAEDDSAETVGVGLEDPGEHLLDDDDGDFRLRGAPVDLDLDASSQAIDLDLDVAAVGPRLDGHVDISVVRLGADFASVTLDGYVAVFGRGVDILAVVFHHGGAVVDAGPSDPAVVADLDVAAPRDVGRDPFTGVVGVDFADVVAVGGGIDLARFRTFDGDVTPVRHGFLLRKPRLERFV